MYMFNLNNVFDNFHTSHMFAIQKLNVIRCDLLLALSCSSLYFDALLTAIEA